MIISFLQETAAACWHILLEAAPFMLLGIIVAGLVKVFLSPSLVAGHLGRGRLGPVIKAAIMGIPLPLCSCGVAPAAQALRKQGAGKGATASFLVATPESGVDSIAMTYALMDPIMTLARPVAAFASAIAAGLGVSFTEKRDGLAKIKPDLTCPVDGCCDGIGCDPAVHKRHHSFWEKLTAGQRYAFGELWGDLAAWFFVGLILAGLITALIPQDILAGYLGGGLGSMLIMLAIGVPMYICSTASTPVAAALMLKGASPGAALVLMLTGPATNLASLGMVVRILGKKGAAIYLACIVVVAVACGLTLDIIYASLALNAAALVGAANEVLPHWLHFVSALVILALSLGPLFGPVVGRVLGRPGLGRAGHSHGHSHGCSGST